MTEKKELKFEKAIQRLEEIVNELETGEFDLDKAIKIFEEGLELSKFCKDKLNKAEQKIEIIKKKNSSNIVNDAETDVEDEKKEDYNEEKEDIGLLLDSDK